jgi:acetyl esterase/lipase
MNRARPSWGCVGPRLRAAAVALALCGLLSCRVTSVPLWGPPAPPPDACAVEVVRGVAYRDGPGADDFRHRLDLFLPRDRTDFPVVVLVHGGFWTQGDNCCCGLYSSVGECLARQGVGVVMPNYRLSPWVRHPEHARDVARAVAWTRAHIAEYGGCPGQLFLAGHSAGAHLAALLATDATYLRDVGMGPAELCGVMAVSGPYRIPEGALEVTFGGATPRAFRFDETLPLRLPACSWSALACLPGIPLSLNVFRPVFGDDPAVRADASPVNHVRPGLPPFLLINADKDFPTLATAAAEFGAALRAKGNEVELLCVPRRNHNSILFRAIDPDDPVAAALLAFVARHRRPAVPVAPASAPAVH